MYTSLENTIRISSMYHKKPQVFIEVFNYAKNYSAIKYLQFQELTFLTKPFLSMYVTPQHSGSVIMEQTVRKQFFYKLSCVYMHK